MRFFYLLRTRTAYIVFFIMTVLSIIALSLAVRMTVIAYKKQNQEIGSPQVASSKLQEQSKSRLPSLKTVNEYPLYFNGSRVEGLMSYETAKGEIMFPVDDLFNYIGIDYTYHSADEILEADFNENKLVLKIGSDKFTINGVQEQLPFAVVLTNDRIMVPAEVLNSLNGFSASGKTYLSAAYVNYNADYKAENFKGIYYTAEIDNTVGIYSINGQRYLNIADRADTQLFDYSHARNTVLYIKEDIPYLLTRHMDFKPIALDMGALSRWSEDYKTVYEPLNNFNYLKIYNPDNGKVKAYGNIREIIASNPDFSDFSSGTLRLASYWSYGDTTRLKVINTRTNKVCTLLYKNNIPILAVKAWISPTGRYMIYEREGQYRLCTYDAQQDIAIDNAQAVMWITDNTFELLNDGEWTAFDVTGHIRGDKSHDLTALGVTGDSVVLYRDSKAIYKSFNNIDEKVADLDVKVDSAVASPGIDTIIAGSRENNTLYLINNSKSTKIADFSLLIKSYGTNGFAEDIKRSVKFSPDGNKLCVALLDKNSVVLRVSKSDGTQSREIRLDSNAYLKSQNIYAGFEFMDNNKLVFHDRDSIWLIDLSGKDPQISRIPESSMNAVITGVMVN